MSYIRRCHISEDVTYYGETSRHFIVRSGEHLGSNKKGNSIKGISLGIRGHINDTGHSASLESFCITHRTNNELDLLINKNLLILRDRHMLYFQSSSMPLCLFLSPRVSSHVFFTCVDLACLPLFLCLGMILAISSIVTHFHI